MTLLLDKGLAKGHMHGGEQVWQNTYAPIYGWRLLNVKQLILLACMDVYLSQNLDFV